MGDATHTTGGPDTSGFNGFFDDCYVTRGETRNPRADEYWPKVQRLHENAPVRLRNFHQPISRDDGSVGRADDTPYPVLMNAYSGSAHFVLERTRPCCGFIIDTPGLQAEWAHVHMTVQQAEPADGIGLRPSVRAPTLQDYSWRARKSPAAIGVKFRRSSADNISRFEVHYLVIAGGRLTSKDSAPIQAGGASLAAFVGRGVATALLGGLGAAAVIATDRRFDWMAAIGL